MTLRLRHCDPGFVPWGVAKHRFFRAMEVAVREDESEGAEYLLRNGVVLTHEGATMEGFPVRLPSL